MDKYLKQKLSSLAEKYETSDFIQYDPSLFMHKYSNPLDQETAAFISSILAFGKRELFMKKLQYLFGLASNSPYSWIKEKKYQKDLPYTDVKFYRFYSYIDIQTTFNALSSILNQDNSLSNYFNKRYMSVTEPTPLSLVQLFIDAFPNCKCIPQTSSSACKRINMFLRWMVRTNSPVDLGIWTWYSPKNLLIPLDIHVLQESVTLGLLSKTASNKLPSANSKACILLTNQMKDIWPEDPCKADFALFGLGINKGKE